MSQPTNELERVIGESMSKIDQGDVPISPPPETASNVTPIANTVPKPRANGATKAAATQTQLPVDRPEPPPPPVVWQKPNYFRGALDKVFGTAEHFKVYKRDELGGTKFLRSYTPKDLDVTRDFEEFIQAYLVPQFGEGQYDVQLVNQKGEVSRAQQFTVADPSRKQGNGEDSSASRVIDVLVERVKGLEAKSNNPPQQKTVSEALTEMKTFMEMMGTGANKADPLVMIKMLEMLRPPTATGPDPVMAAVLEGLKELKTASLRRDPPSLPPPLPVETHRESTAELLAAVASVSKPAMDFKDIIALIKPNQESLSVKDLIALIPTMQAMFQPKQDPMIAALTAKIDAMAKPQTSGLTDALQTFQTIEQLIVRRQPQNTEGESFWGFMKDFAGNFAANVEAIGNMAAKIRDKEATKSAVGGTQSVGATAKAGPSFPNGFDEKCQAIDNATTPDQLIEHTLLAFQFLAMNGAQWRPYMLQMVGLVRKAKGGEAGTKEKALNFVTKFLQGLKEAGKLKTADPIAITKAFDEHFEIVANLVAPPTKEKA